MPYSVRRFREDDAEALSAIIRAAIATIGPRRYSAEQVAAWSARHPGPERFRDRWANGDTILIAVDEGDRPVAYVILEPPDDSGAHLDHLYCHPDHTRRGLAAELLANAEAEARRSGARRLYTEASELARHAFERAGYNVMHRRDFEIDGVPIHNYAMDKGLS